MVFIFDIKFESKEKKEILKMETARINNIINNIYIPPQAENAQPALPKHHPTLIASDSFSDVTHARSCGCKGESCIRDKASWLYGPNGEIKSRSNDCDINSTDAVALQNLSHDSHGRQL